MKKRFLAVILLFAMLLTTMAGCGKDVKEPEGSADYNEPAVTGQPSQDPAMTEPTDGPEDTPQAVTMRNAKEIVAAINVGWNLGNTFDAHGAGNSLTAETRWGNPKTSQAIIDAVAEEGFNAIRLPVTWAEHLGPAPDYKIDEKWLERVAEVVDYCINDNMFVVLNTHHETDYWLYANGDREALCNELAAIWKQIAERFKDYGDLLLFEGMNEPRTKGTPHEWTGGTYEERKTIDAMNMAFYDTVRAAGGNNAERCLILCPYGHNGGSAALSAMTVPEDGHVIIAVHAYTPYFFTYDAEGGYSNWDSSQVSEIKTLASALNTKFILAGIPVIITEFGSVNKKNPDDVIRWITDYMSLMNKYGIKCMWWDNGLYTSNGENFGILNRKTLKWFNQDIADALISNSVSSQAQ
ncbi:MAG: glycoside hydrolase family 5 protein [Lachnospiraceae bacterium]|nr:glycoside hydrolase family 5 protein [Lachnospiraceae bacterium]